MENTINKNLDVGSAVNGSTSLREPSAHRELPLGKPAKMKTKVFRTTPVSGKSLNSIQFNRHFTDSKVKPLEIVEYIKATSKIKDTEGHTVFQMKDVEVPAAWSQLAVDIL